MQTKRVRYGVDVWRSLVLSSFMDLLCRVINTVMYVPSWRTVCALCRVLFWCLFHSLLHNSGNKYQNDPLVSTQTVCYMSKCIIFYWRKYGFWQKTYLPTNTKQSSETIMSTLFAWPGFNQMIWKRKTMCFLNFPYDITNYGIYMYYSLRENSIVIKLL